MSIADDLERLAAQRDAGRLTDAEYQAAKARLLGDPAAAAAGPTRIEGGVAVNALRRSRGDRWIGGVCGGIARMAGVESWIVRLLFVVGVLFAGLGFIPYVLLWIFVPSDDASTATPPVVR